MNYVLGGGVSGLLWAYYHKECELITDKMGRAVTGTDAMVWLNATPLTQKLLRELDVPGKVVEKPIGYLTPLDHVVEYQQASPGVLEAILRKKMIPWDLLEAARVTGMEIRIVPPSRTFTKDNGVLRYHEVSVRDLCERMVEEVGDRVVIGRVESITEEEFVIEGLGRYSYQHLISTLPAPVFARMWRGNKKFPRLHWLPVTYLISRDVPAWWDERYAMVYIEDASSPAVRAAQFGERFVYEVTGVARLGDAEKLRPKEAFVNPYGRIIQDVQLTEPNERITFLGRAAEWDFRGLVDRTLERVLGLR